MRSQDHQARLSARPVGTRVDDGGREVVDALPVSLGERALDQPLVRRRVVRHDGPQPGLRELRLRGTGPGTTREISPKSFAERRSGARSRGAQKESRTSVPRAELCGRELGDDGRRFFYQLVARADDARGQGRVAGGP